MIVLKEVNIVTMVNEEILYEHDVIIEDHKIHRIVPSTTVDYPKNAKVVPCKGKYLMPGLHEMHYHMSMPYGFNFNIPLGITTVRNCSGFKEIKDFIGKANQSDDYPTIYSYSPGIVGPEFPIGMVHHELYNCETLEDCDKAVEQTIEDGWDYVKILENIDKDFFERIYNKCKEKGVKIGGHINNKLGYKNALAIAKNDYCLEHIFLYIPEDKIESYANENFYATTAYIKAGDISDLTDDYKDSAIYNREVEKYLEEYLPEDTRIAWVDYYEGLKKADKLRETLGVENEDYPLIMKSSEYNAKIAAKFFKAGGKLMAGTDVIAPFLVPGLALHQELEHFVAAGLTPFEALTTATVYPTEWLGTNDISGTVEVGKIADLVILHSSPLDDIKNARDVHCVLKNGTLHSREKLDAMLRNKFVLPELGDGYKQYTNDFKLTMDMF